MEYIIDVPDTPDPPVGVVTCDEGYDSVAFSDVASSSLRRTTYSWASEVVVLLFPMS